MPSQTFTATATAAVPVEEVWASLDRPETWASIGGVDRVFDAVEDEQGQLTGFSFESVAAGKRYVGRARPARRDEGRLMAWDIANSEIQGVTTVALAPLGKETEITVTLEVQSAGLLSAMFFPVIAGAIGNGLPDAVSSFAASFAATLARGLTDLRTTFADPASPRRSG